MKSKIKTMIKIMTKVLAITFLYDILLTLFNIPDEITLFSCITSIIYSLISIVVVEWAFED